ncbi:alpha/beta hydrolase [Williamsia maris]|uniref:Alpha/beta hydrolase family protein n=1 Tax=Williamsia maris TaxID=72806 RepID=A0ABT1HKH9_9NOCA|nr:alpha/beta hydrolase [Williamsia maris]MCP2178437.1 Alpha/beta hydrolase family protein [Williamsia maris]
MTDSDAVSAATLSRPSALVALPGTGSDADYARRAFAPAAQALGVELIAVDPTADGIEAGYRRALDAAAARHRHLLVGGVSIGACVALDWAVDDDRCVGVFAALPPWIDSARDAPASHSARATAALIDRLGLDGAIEDMVAGSPAWLGAELRRSWSAIGPALRAHLGEAAEMAVPTHERIAALRVPLIITAAVDDPVHPIAVARRWAECATMSVLRSVTLEQWGADAAILGRESVQGWIAMTDGDDPSGSQRP